MFGLGWHQRKVLAMSETTAQSAPAEAARTNHPLRWAILALVLAAECMDLLDSTIVNVAAPSISRDLHAGASQLQWIIGGYALTFAIGLIAGGRLGDIYGRRRLFVIGALGFVVTSAACGFAVNPAMLISCRLAQGFAAAMLIPQGLGIIRSVFAPSDLGRAFALFGPVIGLSAMLGPILGGVLVDANAFGTAWRAVFFINLPLGLAAAIGAARIVPESLVPNAPKLDVVGTVLVAAATGAVVYPLIQGRTYGWPVWTYLMMVAGALLFVAFVGWTRRATRTGRSPLIESSVFGHRGYSAGLASIVVFFGGMSGTMLVLGLYLQFGEHFSAIHAGLTLAPFALGAAIGATVSAAVLAPRIGRTVLHIGCVVLAGAVFWLYETVQWHGLHTTTAATVPPELMFGIGLGMLVSPLFDFVLASVTDAETGSASGVLNALQQLAGAVGVAVIGTIFFAALSRHGYVVALKRCLIVELGTMPVLALLIGLLPKHAREQHTPEAQTTEENGALTSVAS
jgi:EmrB/QacA subfamily drug resistance transporter